MTSIGAAAPSHEGALLMVVDDDPLLRESMAATLSARGFRVSEYGSGEEAWNALQRRELPDVILLDLRLPGIDGWTFRRKQLDDTVLAAIPVVAMSGDHSAKATAVHADAFVTKPLAAAELMSAIEVALRSRRRRGRRVSAYRRRAAHRHARSLARAPLPMAPDGQHPYTERREGLLLHFVGLGISHVVNNALQGLLSYAQALGGHDDEDHPGQRAVLDAAFHCADVLRTFASCAYSAQSGLLKAEEPPAREPALIEAWRQLCTERVDLRVTSPHLLREAGVCTSTLLAVTNELIRNAVEALGEAKGTVRVQVSVEAKRAASLQRALPVMNRHAGTWCCIEVRDDGPGISRQALDLIWLPFYSTRFAGRGLGLSTVLSRMAQLGGLVEAESQQGAGATFRLLFPMGSVRTGDDGSDSGRILWPWRPDGDASR
jgi:signal transduction histidine kinase